MTDSKLEVLVSYFDRNSNMPMGKAFHALMIQGYVMADIRHAFNVWVAENS